MKVNSHIPNLKTKTHLIFDLDGTLIDSLNIWNVIDQAVLKGLNIVVPLDILQQEHTIFFKKENSYQSSSENYIWLGCLCDCFN